jgi:hypothetical protein
MDKNDPILERLDSAKAYLQKKAGMFDPEFLQVVATLVAVARDQHVRIQELEREVAPGNQFVDMTKMDIPGQVRP